MKKGSLQSRLRRYSIVREGSELWKDVGYREWADFVRLGKPACISQIIGFFKTGWSTEFVQVCTGRSFRKGRLPGEWESRVWDGYDIDLVNPLYCRGVLEAIEAMHGAAVAQARSWLRKYVPREVDYSENILSAADPWCLAKSPDFEVRYFEAYAESDPENPYRSDEPWLPEPIDSGDGGDDEDEDDDATEA
jgi:hypothetical protein